MTRAKYIAKEYLDRETNLEKIDKQKLIKEYDRINNLGIPFTCYGLLLSYIIKIIVYSVLSLI